MDVQDFIKQYNAQKKIDLSKKYMTVKECADLLKFTPYTIREKLKSGEIKGVKIGKEWRIPIA